MGLSRRRFTREFKLAALQRLEMGGSVAEVARAFEVGPNVLHGWRCEFRQRPGKVFPGAGKRRWDEGRVARLKDRSAVQEALHHTTEIVNRTIKPLLSRKGARRQVEYLRQLRDKWARGLKSLAAHRRRETNAVFFLGDPMRLPLP